MTKDPFKGRIEVIITLYILITVLKGLPSRDLVSLSVNFPDQNTDSDLRIEPGIINFKLDCP